MDNKHFLKLVRNRRSIRRYLPDPVDRDRILTCLEAARLAPSADNVQPWRFLVVDDPEIKERVAKAAFSGVYAISKFSAQAPVLVVLLARPDLFANKIAKWIQGTQFYLLDMGIAGEHFVLQAEELGLSTCWIGWFNASGVAKVLDIPKKYKPVAMMPLGYAASRPPKDTKRKSMEEIAWFNRVEG